MWASLCVYVCVRIWFSNFILYVSAVGQPWCAAAAAILVVQAMQTIEREQGVKVELKNK